MSSTDFVEFNVGQVKSPGMTTAEESAYSELVRSLSSFGRAVVKHLSSKITLRQYVQEAFADAEKTASAELHLERVANGSSDVSSAAGVANQQELATKVARIVQAKSKRLKQHSRRAAKRANRNASGSANAVQNNARWPTLIAETAENFQEWKVDLFMHVAMLVMSEHFEGKGIMVNRKDETRTKQQQKQVKKIIHFHGAEVGVDKFELKGFAFVSRATGLLVKPSQAHQLDIL
jgi:hypothetical protein